MRNPSDHNSSGAENLDCCRLECCCRLSVGGLGGLGHADCYGCSPSSPEYHEYIEFGLQPCSLCDRSGPCTQPSCCHRIQVSRKSDSWETEKRFNFQRLQSSLYPNADGDFHTCRRSASQATTLNKARNMIQYLYVRERACTSLHDPLAVSYVPQTRLSLALHLVLLF